MDYRIKQPQWRWWWLVVVVARLLWIDSGSPGAGGPFNVLLLVGAAKMELPPIIAQSEQQYSGSLFGRRLVQVLPFRIFMGLYLINAITAGTPVDSRCQNLI